MMRWSTKRPVESGFYYWQNNELLSISDDAVRVVYVGKYKNRDGFCCYTLTRGGEYCSPVFDCDLGQEPLGMWFGPLPQPE